MHPQYDDETAIEWTTPNGNAPDIAWIREAPIMRGTRQGRASDGALAHNANIRSPGGTVLGYSVLAEDADNLAQAGQLPSPLGKAKFARRLFYLADEDDPATQPMPDDAVPLAAVIVGHPSTPPAAAAEAEAEPDHAPDEPTRA